jgi:hypothetical protein
MLALMSAFKHPVGPQSSSVYWRRRLVVLLGVVTVIVVIVLIVVRPGSSSGEPAKPTASSSPGAADPTSAPTTGAAASGQTCAPTDVKVDAVTDQASYAADQTPQLSIALTNTGGAPCTIDAGTAQQVFIITSGSDVYWTSTDCQTDEAEATVLLEPGKTISSQTPITWDRTRSNPSTCQAPRELVPAGGVSYHLQTSVAGIASSNTKQFILQ